MNWSLRIGKFLPYISQKSIYDAKCKLGERWLSICVFNFDAWLPSTHTLLSHQKMKRARDAELIDFFQNAPIAMHWLNGNGIILWANQTELNVLGYTAEEYIGKPIMNFCPDEEKLVLQIFKQLGSGNTIADVPVRFRTKDGKMVHLLIDSNVAYNKDGSFGHTRCFIRDDTSRKIRDARSKLLLEETERVRGEEVYGIFGSYIFPPFIRCVSSQLPFPLFLHICLQSLRMLDGFLSRTLHHVMGPRK